MATLIKCDKCGVTIDTGIYKCIKGYVPAIKHMGIDYPNNEIDVCNECYNEIFNIKEDNK